MIAGAYRGKITRVDLPFVYVVAAKLGGNRALRAEVVQRWGPSTLPAGDPAHVHELEDYLVVGRWVAVIPVDGVKDEVLVLGPVSPPAA